MAYFPMFVEITGRNCLIAGGGKIALRKVRVMKEFGAKIFVVAPDICEEIKADPEITYDEKSFEESDLDGISMVVAASDDKALNHSISLLCREKKIPVNAVDQVEDCSFIFPSYLKEGDLVAAFSSAGKSPVMTQYLKEQTRPVLTEKLGELTELLGSIRDEVKQTVSTEEMRKQVYQEILSTALSAEELPTEEQMQKIIDRKRTK